MASKWERWATLSGAVAVLLWIIGFVTIGETKDEAAEILAQVRNDDARIIIGSIIFMIGCGFFLWFLGSLRTRLLAAEGPTARVTAIAFAAGVGTAVCLTLLPAALAAAAINSDDIDASAASAMVNLGDAFFLGAEYLAPVLLVAFAVVALRHGAFPKWLAWLGIAVGILFFSPAFFVGLVGVPVWVLIASVLGISRAGRAAPATA